MSRNEPIGLVASGRSLALAAASPKHETYPMRKNTTVAPREPASSSWPGAERGSSLSARPGAGETGPKGCLSAWTSDQLGRLVSFLRLPP
eukprot:scaffold50077_cov35-Tisochrysis_lutea.AAC.1